MAFISEVSMLGVSIESDSSASTFSVVQGVMELQIITSEVSYLEASLAITIILGYPGSSTAATAMG